MLVMFVGLGSQILAKFEFGFARGQFGLAFVFGWIVAVGSK